MRMASPVRQVLYLSMPEVSDGYDAEIRIDITFRDFGMVESLLQPVPGPAGAWQTEWIAVTDVASGGLIGNFSIPAWLANATRMSLLVLLCCVAMAGLIVAYRREPRRVYFGVALGMAALLILQPVLQLGDVTGIRARSAAAAEQQAQDQQFNTMFEEQTRHLPQFQVSNPDDPIQLIETCGDGSRAIDSDNDGLDDFTEGCVGTDPYAVDTDEDLITDTLELEGFTYGGRTWKLDPFKQDANGDGLPDFSEWVAPIGNAPEWDIDGDTIPNPWDDDNDGDGVTDGIDLSPFSSTAYTDTFQLQTSTQQSFNGYQYIELQIQPEDPDALRYTATALNWPTDDKGQIADLDNSAEDLRLVPMLAVEANVAPPVSLAEKYGVAVIQDGSAAKFYAPLYPVEDSGRITAFYTKVAYDPADLANIEWDAKLVWIVQAELDAYTDCQDPANPTANTCTIDTTSSSIHIYEDTFRVTGMHITRSRNVEVSLFATPDLPDEDYTLFSLIMGLNGTFLEGESLEDQDPGRTFLQEIQYRIEQPNTTPEQKFGITQTMVIDHATYSHIDAAIAATSQEKIPGFLDANGYQTIPVADQCTDLDGNRFPCAALVSAVQEESGIYSLDDAGIGVDGDTDLTVSFAADVFTLLTNRSVQYNMYGYQANRWRALDTATILQIVDNRYNMDSLAATLQDDFPGVEADDLRFFTYTLYMAWNTGRYGIVKLGNTSLQPKIPAVETAKLGFKLIKNVTSSLPTYIFKLAVDEFRGQQFTYTRSELQFNADGSPKIDPVTGKQESKTVTKKVESDWRKIKDTFKKLRSETNAGTKSALRGKFARIAIAGVARAVMIGAAVVLITIQIAKLICENAENANCDAQKLNWRRILQPERFGWRR
ncbi:MAG: hypothetical protein HC893_09335 [Chloroflexaceae bacterium]|nr:hypothetical protein [Chloroflexaceae bacterium]